MCQSSGGSLVNLYWAWQTTGDVINAVLKTGQPIIAFEKYGLTTPSVNKSVLRHLILLEMSQQLIQQARV